MPSLRSNYTKFFFLQNLTIKVENYSIEADQHFDTKIILHFTPGILKQKCLLIRCTEMLKISVTQMKFQN